MEYLRLLYELPAIVAGTTILAYLSPWKVQHRFMPFVMFLVALVVLNIPEMVSLALALTIPAAYFQGMLGIKLHDHEPLKVKLPKFKAPKLTIQQFVTKDSPGVVPDEDEEDEDKYDDDVPVVKSDEPPNVTVTAVPKFVPEL